MTHMNEILKATQYFLGLGTQWHQWSDVTGSRKSKMAAIKPEELVSQLIVYISPPIQRLTPIFWVQQLCGTIANTARRNRKSDFKDGDRQTGSTYISASRLDSNAVPTASPKFIYSLEAEI